MKVLIFYKAGEYEDWRIYKKPWYRSWGRFLIDVVHDLDMREEYAVDITNLVKL